MTDPAPNQTEQIKAFVSKHKVALGIGAAVLLLLAMSNGGQQAGPSPNDPGYDTTTTTGPGFDKEKWDRDQRQSDREQKDRIDTIREVERCVTSDGTVVEVPAGTCT